MTLLKEWQSYQFALFTALHVGQRSKDGTILEYLGGTSTKKASAIGVPTQGSKDSWGAILQGVEVAHVYASLDRLTEHQRAMVSFIYAPRYSDKEISLLQNYGWDHCARYGVPQDERNFERQANFLLSIQYGLKGYKKSVINEERPGHTDGAASLGISRPQYKTQGWEGCVDELYDAYEKLNGSALRRVAQYFNDIDREEVA